MANLIIHTDGGARGNPGPAAVGVVIKSEDGKVLGTVSRRIGQTTNNVAEYSAVVAALEWVKENAAMKQCGNETMIYFFLDSTLVVNQLNGLWKLKDGSLRELLMKIRILEAEIGRRVYYAYIPREKNSEADALVNKALDELSY